MDWCWWLDSSWIRDGQILVIGTSLLLSSPPCHASSLTSLLPTFKRRALRKGRRLIYRYILKLFRDFVFHSIGVDNAPVLDLSHVLTCLNKVRFPLTSHHQDETSSSLMIAWRRIRREDHVGFEGWSIVFGSLISRDQDLCRSCLFVSPPYTNLLRGRGAYGKWTERSEAMSHWGDRGRGEERGVGKRTGEVMW